MKTATASTPLYTQYYPRTYVAPYIAAPIPTIDGNLSKAVWQQAPWSDIFDDIRGPDDAPPEERPPASCSTKVKMLWSSTHLYIGALLEADGEHPVIRTFKNRNDPIYQQDSDFEVFIDPDESTHFYKEFEVNALSTVWNLMLDKPYFDGGVEHSGRIAQPDNPLYYDVVGQETAVQVLEGNLNAFAPTKWTIEIAMSYKDLFVMTASDGSSPPTPSTRWRINFSRVERKGDINWTWQPQIEWNAEEKSYRGEVNMHLPNAWGYLVFGEAIEDGQDELIGVTTAANVEEPETTNDPQWPIRMAAMSVYAAQHAYRDKHGIFTSDFSSIQPWLDMDLINDVSIGRIRIHTPTKDLFDATIHSRNYEATIRQDRLLSIEAMRPPTEAELNQNNTSVQS
jgi:hypothetical protein